MSGLRRASATLLLLPLLAGCGGTEETPSEPGPGMVLVVVDTMRADHLGAYGYERDTSPNLDRLAAEGAVFDAAITQASFSGPSYATILTGLLPQEHGVRNHPETLPADLETLAEAARRQGVRTAAVVTHPFLGSKWGFDQGFSDYELVEAPEGAAIPGGSVADVVARANEWLQGLEPGERFLLFVQVMEPHMPYQPPPPFDTAFGDEREGFTLMDEVAAARGGHGAVMFSFRESGYTDADLERAVELYDGTIAYVDSALQGLWDGLQAAGRMDDSVVAVTADHREMLGEHDLYFHHDMSLYDPVVRVPLILRYPRTVPAGHRVPSQVRLMDLAPTLLGLAGLEPPAGATGRSLASLLQGGAGRELVAFTENQPLQEDRLGLPHYRMAKPGIEGKWRSVRSGGHKLILIPTADGIREELYDLLADPGETVNLIGERPEIEERLRRLLGQTLASDPAMAGGQEERELDEGTLEELKALGYVG